MVKTWRLKLKENIKGSIKFFTKRAIQTDGVHQKDRTGPGVNSDEAWSEAVKIIKGFCQILPLEDLKEFLVLHRNQSVGKFSSSKLELVP